MVGLDHDMMQQWLNLEMDGELLPDQKRRLEAHLESCAECRTERESLLRLRRLLEADRVEVHPDFRAQVVAALPAAGWEARTPRAWRLPAALLLGLLASAVALVSTTTSPLPSGFSVLAALGVVFELFQVSVLAGAGLLAASWKGLGLAVAEVLASSVVTKVTFVVAVVGVNALLISLLRRRPAAQRARADSSPRGRDHG
jgi:anti-sigma factor RsiW